MSSILNFIPLALGQNIGPQVLARIPEPDHQVVTDNPQSVAEYDQVMNSKLAISYALATETIFRTRTQPIKSALDVACGPGHLTINMARDLEIEQMIGVDLSNEMIKTASANARQRDLSSVQFEHGDATRLRFENQRFDLCTMMDAAHHFPSLDTLSSVLAELDRVCNQDGLVVVMDLVRLRTEAITEKYVNLVGREYKSLGLTDFFNQFRDSMYAAWTADELNSAIPNDSNRNWISIVPRGIPFCQFLLGLPGSQQTVFQCNGKPWKVPPVRQQDRLELNLASMGLNFAATTQLVASR
jgi:ubiquinone/menaquinone biosynthesis C-methylase UbiE